MGITLTEKAAENLKRIADETDSPLVLRAGVKGGGCSGFNYHLDLDDNETPMDVVFESQGIEIRVDEMSLQYLEGTEIDYQDGLFGDVGFRFLNPNARSTCGCAQSFSV